jgi:hypothetical protein
MIYFLFISALYCEYYVSNVPSGSDSNDCLTDQTPCETIQHIVDIYSNITEAFNIFIVECPFLSYPVAVNDYDIFISSFNRSLNTSLSYSPSYEDDKYLFTVLTGKLQFNQLSLFHGNISKSSFIYIGGSGSVLIYFCNVSNGFDTPFGYSTFFSFLITNSDGSSLHISNSNFINMTFINNASLLSFFYKGSLSVGNSSFSSISLNATEDYSSLSSIVFSSSTIDIFISFHNSCFSNFSIPLKSTLVYVYGGLLSFERSNFTNISVDNNHSSIIFTDSGVETEFVFVFFSGIFTVDSVANSSSSDSSFKGVIFYQNSGNSLSIYSSNFTNISVWDKVVNSGIFFIDGDGISSLHLSDLSFSHIILMGDCCIFLLGGYSNFSLINGTFVSIILSSELQNSVCYCGGIIISSSSNNSEIFAVSFKNSLFSRFYFMDNTNDELKSDGYNLNLSVGLFSFNSLENVLLILDFVTVDTAYLSFFTYLISVGFNSTINISNSNFSSINFASLYNVSSNGGFLTIADGEYIVLNVVNSYFYDIDNLRGNSFNCNVKNDAVVYFEEVVFFNISFNAYGSSLFYFEGNISIIFLDSLFSDFNFTNFFSVVNINNDNENEYYTSLSVEGTNFSNIFSSENSQNKNSINSCCNYASSIPFGLIFSLSNIYNSSFLLKNSSICNCELNSYSTLLFSYLSDDLDSSDCIFRLYITCNISNISSLSINNTFVFSYLFIFNNPIIDLYILSSNISNITNCSCIYFYGNNTINNSISISVNSSNFNNFSSDSLLTMDGLLLSYSDFIVFSGIDIQNTIISDIHSYYVGVLGHNLTFSNSLSMFNLKLSNSTFSWSCFMLVELVIIIFLLLLLTHYSILSILIQIMIIPP